MPGVEVPSAPEHVFRVRIKKGNPMVRAPSFLSACILSVAALVLVSGNAPMATAQPPKSIEDDLYSIVRGGRLYDNWYEETGERIPKKSHPAYPSDKAFANDPDSNWRCKECHGWDYRGRDGVYSKDNHYTGIKGIDAMAGADPQEVIAVLKDPTHAFRTHKFPGFKSPKPLTRDEIIAIFKERRFEDRGWLDDRDLKDLANFVAKGQIDMDRFINRDTGNSKGNKTNGEIYYTTICTTCHGRDGLNIKSIPPLGKVAKGNPWETLHKILNGHPGVMMPPFRVLGIGVSVDILAYAQTLPKEQILASIVRGGRLYDNWIKEAGKPVPTKRHSAYPDNKAYADNPAYTWRCKECHGWDYRGLDGAYSEGRHYTGIKGIREMAGADTKTIVAVLINDTHEYGRVLEFQDIEDLATFVSKGQVDMNRFIDRRSKKAIGKGENSRAFFTTLCATCHGMDGGEIITMRPLGYFSRHDPWETLHKILNGHPNRIMPPLRVLDTKALVNTLAYIQTLPAKRH